MNVVVVGGGVIGCAVALALADHGAEVQIVDMRGPGMGATQASAGMLAPYIEGHEDRLRRLGVHSLSLYDDFVRRVRAASGRPIEYRRTGTLQVACSPLRASQLEADAARLAGDNVACSLLSAEGVRELEPAISDSVLSGLFVPSHGYVRVGQLMSALEEAAVRRGVRILVERVVGVERAPRGAAVVTTEGRIEASVAVIAAGAWCGQLAVSQSPQMPVRPIKGQLAEVVVAPGSLSHVVWSEDCYLVPWEDGTVLVGATLEDVGFDELPSDDAQESLLAAGAAVLPRLAAGALHPPRVGLRPATRDELPVIGWLSTQPRVCLAAGHYRNGILLAPMTAALVTEIVLDAAPRQAAWIRDAVAPSRLGL